MIEIEQKQIEIEAEQLKTWKPFFALPCYDRQVTEPFMMSLLKTCMAFKEYGIDFGLGTVTDSLISRARNQLVAKFMANKVFTHLFFIDVDLGFNHEDVLKMLWHEKDVMTGAYPIKNIDWEKVVKLVKNDTPADKLAAKSVRFVVNPTSGENNQVRVDNGALSIYDAGTGFMMIKRGVFERMFEKYPHLKYVDDTGALVGDERNHSYALFNSYVDRDGRFLSEDYGFCRYLQDMGEEIWVDPSIELMHLGRFEYKGSMMEWIVDNATPQS